MLALDDGLTAPDDLACSQVPQRREDPLRSQITVFHLATHTSGIEDAEADGKPHNQLTGWKGEFWTQDPNPFLTARDEAPVLFEPGTRSKYSDPGMTMLSYCVPAALCDDPQSDLRTLRTERLIDPIGVPRGEWSMSYGRSFDTDGLTLYANWDGQQLVSPEMVDLVTADQGVPTEEQGEPARRCGLGWWQNANGAVAALPRDAFFGSGAGNQRLLVIPSLDLIVVRNGSEIRPEGHCEGVEDDVLELPLATVVD